MAPPSNDIPCKFPVSRELGSENLVRCRLRTLVLTEISRLSAIAPELAGPACIRREPRCGSVQRRKCDTHKQSLQARRSKGAWFCRSYGPRSPRKALSPRAGSTRGTAGIDLALAMIENDLGADVARAVARKLVVYHRRSGGQSQFSTLPFLRPTTHFFVWWGMTAKTLPQAAYGGQTSRRSTGVNATI